MNLNLKDFLLSYADEVLHSPFVTKYTKQSMTYRFCVIFFETIYELINQLILNNKVPFFAERIYSANE